MRNRILAFFVVPLLLLSVCAAQAREEAPAAVAVSRDRDGVESFFIFGTGATGKLADLPDELRKSGYREADLSAWSSQIDYDRLLSALAQKGIRVTRCYVPDSGKASWFRKNLAGPEPRERRRRPLSFVRALIKNNSYNRRYKLPGKFETVKYVTIHNTAEPFSARQEREKGDQKQARDRGGVQPLNGV